MTYWMVIVFVSYLMVNEKVYGQCYKQQCSKKVYRKGGFFSSSGWVDQPCPCLICTIQNTSTNLDYSACSTGKDKECLSVIFLATTSSHISKEQFSGLKTGKLYLNNTRIESMDADVFFKLDQVRILHLENNRLKKIHPGNFEGMVSLNELHIENNLIALIESDAFLGLPSLIELYLGHNKIKHISKQIFSTFRNLRVLDISFNLLSVLNFDFSNSIHITQLYINNNKLSYIPIGTMNLLKNLTILNLSHNLIQELDYGVLAGLRKLTYFDISYNNLSGFDVKLLYSLNSLKILNVSYTNIEKISIQRLAFYCKNLKQISMLGLQLTCPKLFEIITDAGLNNITIEEGFDNDNSNIIGMSCIKKVESDNNSKSDESTSTNIEESFDKAFEKSRLYHAIEKLAKLMSQNSTISVKHENSNSEDNADEIKIFLENEFRNYTKESNDYHKKMLDFFNNFKNDSLYKLTVSNDTSSNDIKFGKIMNVLEQLLSRQTINALPQSGRLESDVSNKIESCFRQLQTTVILSGCFFFVLWFGMMVFKLFINNFKSKLNNTAVYEMQFAGKK